MFGFVYEWLDQETGMKYVGSHHGPSTDRYTGSGKWFKSAYRKRPKSFVRRIISVNDTVDDLQYTFKLEQQELDKIPRGEFGKSYYNLKPFACGGAVFGRTTPTSVREKIGKSVSANLERGRNISAALLGKRKTVEACLNMSKAKTGKPNPKRRKEYLLEHETGSQKLVIGLGSWLAEQGIPGSSFSKSSKRNEFYRGWKLIAIQGVSIHG